MQWKLTDDRPIWLQLTEQLTERIVSGVYPTGSRMPPVRELAAEAGVNPNTMQRALAQLEADSTKWEIYALMSQSIHQHSKS